MATQTKSTAGKAPAKNTPRRKAAATKKAPRKASGSSRATPKRPPGQWPPEQQQAAAKLAAEQPMITTLRAEHRHIAGVMKLFSVQLRALDADEPVDTHVVYEIMDYMVSWPGRFHHPREDLIYGRVAEIDDRAADNVDTLQREHDEMAGKGRDMLEEIAAWRGGAGNGAAVVEKGRYYVERMYAHMNNEEELVFPQIESILTAQDWRELSAEDKLRPLSDPLFGPKVSREFRNLGRKLRRNLRQGVERGTLMEWIGVESLMESLEVLAMANDSARSVTSDHLHAAWIDVTKAFQEAPLKAPFACVASNTRHTMKWAAEVLEISRETFGDLARVNQERLERMRLLDFDH